MNTQLVRAVVAAALRTVLQDFRAGLGANMDPVEFSKRVAQWPSDRVKTKLCSRPLMWVPRKRDVAKTDERDVVRDPERGT